MDYGGEEIEDSHPLICPLCEVHELDTYGRNSTLCPHCGLFGGVFLESLRQVSALPEVHTLARAITFGQALAILLIGGPLAALFASWPIALGQG